MNVFYIFYRKETAKRAPAFLLSYTTKAGTTMGEELVESLTPEMAVNEARHFLLQGHSSYRASDIRFVKVTVSTSDYESLLRALKG